MFKINVAGVDMVMLQFRNIATQGRDAARKRMRRAADRAEQRAKDMTPEDEGDLMNSIHQEDSRENGSSGRLQIDIVAGGMSPLGDRNIDDYAAIIHENYEAILKDPEKMARNAAKEARTGEKVGSHFLTRAIEPEQDRLAQEIVEGLQEVDGIE